MTRLQSTMLHHRCALMLVGFGTRVALGPGADDAGIVGALPLIAYNIYEVLHGGVRQSPPEAHQTAAGAIWETRALEERPDCTGQRGS